MAARIAAVVAVVALVALAGCGSGGSKTKTTSRSEILNPVTLTYMAEPYGAPVTPAATQRTVELMRERLHNASFKGAVEASAGHIVATLPGPISGRTVEAISRTAELYFYDWEPNVIGTNGNPDPNEGTVTGDATLTGAAGATSGVPQYDAVLRASKRPPIIRSNETTYSPGCTAAQTGGCLYGAWYLVDTQHHRMLCRAGGPICPAQATQSALFAEYAPPPDAHQKSIRVNPGTILVQARPVETSSGKVTNANPNSWYVLNDDPVLTGADLTNPQQGFDEGAGGSGQPNVTFGFTQRGKSVFERITREIAHRGQEAQLPGMSKEAALQHFAVVLDGQIITAPSIDYTKYPEGIDATTGSQISGGLTIASARELVEDLGTGTLPLRLRLVASTP